MQTHKYGPHLGIGWIIAFFVLVAVLIFWIGDYNLTKDWTLGLIAALAAARLL